MALVFGEDNIKNLTFVLSKRDYTHLGAVQPAESPTIKRNLNSADELSFSIIRNEYNEHIWNEIKPLRLLWYKEENVYFEIDVALSDSMDVTKTITAKSLCEAELSQVVLHNIEINTEADILRDDYTLPTVFYRDLHDIDPQSQLYTEYKNSSLLHRILDKVPHYSIGYVQRSLWNLQRSFSISDSDIYSWLSGECSEQFNCIFKFDSTARKINVYDLYSNCQNEKCQYRGLFYDSCPECGSTDITYFGKDTTILVSKDNLTEEINFETDTSSIKNCFRLEAGDDDMTAAVININPNGSQYIYYVSDDEKEDMPAELVDKINWYDNLVATLSPDYEDLADKIYDAIDQVGYYKHSMMPTGEYWKCNACNEQGLFDDKCPECGSTNLYHHEATPVYNSTAQQEADKLVGITAVALAKVETYTSQATVESAIKNYAKVFIRTGYFRVTIESGTYAFRSKGDASWSGKLKVTNYSNEEDVGYINLNNVTVTENFSAYLKQKSDKILAGYEDDSNSLYDVLSNESDEAYTANIKLYSYVRLESFYDAYQSVLDTLLEFKTTSGDETIYNQFYNKYYNRLAITEAEMNVRSASIDKWQTRLDSYNVQKAGLQDQMNFRKCLGDELYNVFCAYRREDTYSNSNYISDGLSNSELFDNARDFMATAKKELFKSATRQHSISTTLYNLLCIKEFEPLIESFELGNWIRVRIDDDIYRLRLTSYELNGTSLNNINVEFSDMTITADGMNDIQSILSKASSMSSSYSYVSKQAGDGNSALREIDAFRQNGLNAAHYRIMSNNNEEAVIDNHGVLLRTWNETGEIYQRDANGDLVDIGQGQAQYDPEQLRLTHNMLCYTSDNWKTTRTAIGKTTYTDWGGEVKEAYGVCMDKVCCGVIV